MGWIGQKGGPKVEEEKNVATAERTVPSRPIIWSRQENWPIPIGS